jgi:hypothetical protein
MLWLLFSLLLLLCWQGDKVLQSLGLQKVVNGVDHQRTCHILEETVGLPVVLHAHMFSLLLLLLLVLVLVFVGGQGYGVPRPPKGGKRC